MSGYTMADRVELSEALRSILDDSESELEEQKENIDVGFQDVFASPRMTSRGIKRFLSPINRARGFTKTGHSPQSALTLSTDPFRNGTISEKWRKSEFDCDQSPPKKRRHANHVIILRQPRRKTKQQKSSPKPNSNQTTDYCSKRPSAQTPTTDSVRPQSTSKEFTIELETGIAGTPQQCKTDLNSRQDTSYTVNTSSRTKVQSSNENMEACLTTTTSTPPRLASIEAPGSMEKDLDAAIECQIKLEPSEEELESGLPVLDRLDPTASPFCHFKDSSQRQLYSELSTLDDDRSAGCPWPVNQEEMQLAASQQLLQCAGKFYYSEEGLPLLQGEGPLGRWVARGGSADDSLTNITWLKRMSAPDLDPSSLQTAQMMDPRFERPPYSYSTLIQFAISSSRTGKMTLREIYAWIEDTFPYFKTAKAGWRNSIRHNLSLHKIFIREPPMTHGQPAFWTLRPGTVVRLPERKMFVADPENGGTLLQEVVPPPSAVPSGMSGSYQGVPCFRGGARPQVVMVPMAAAGVAAASKFKENSGPGVKTKKPPLILPRGSQPYALVPVPLLLPPNQDGDRPAAVPHILSPIIMGGVRRFAATSGPRMVGGRRVVPIAPKMSVGDGSAHNSGVNGTGSGSTSMNGSVCNTTSGSDSGVELSGHNLTSNHALTSDTSSCGYPVTPNRNLQFKKQRQGRKSLPRIREDIDDETEAEDSFTAFFEQELASPLARRPHPKGVPVVSTPCKPSDFQNWFSPLSGLTPFKNAPLDGDSGIFHDVHDDLPLPSFPTGLTPNLKNSQRGITRGQRSRIGSLGDLGLPGLTPEKEGQSTDGIHNHSFGQIFGDLSNLDVDGDGLDIGNLSWSMFTPNKQQAT